MVNELFLLAADETLVAASRPVAPYVVVLWGAAVLIVGLLLFNYLTRAGTIARATIKEAVRQPVFLLLLGTSALIILANTYVPFFSMGDDTKMFMDCGLATILICSLLLSVWTASISVADEIEGKTAMTLLSKPITRRQFIVGKYLGIVQGSLLLILISGAIFFVFTYYKFGYDYRESGKGSLELFNWTAVSWAPFEIPMPLENRLNASLQILARSGAHLHGDDADDRSECGDFDASADAGEHRQLLCDLRDRAPDAGAGAVGPQGSGVREVRRTAAGDDSALTGQLQHVGGRGHRKGHSGRLHRIVSRLLCRLRAGGHAAGIHPV